MTNTRRHQYKQVHHGKHISQRAKMDAAVHLQTRQIYDYSLHSAAVEGRGCSVKRVGLLVREGGGVWIQGYVHSVSFDKKINYSLSLSTQIYKW